MKILISRALSSADSGLKNSMKVGRSQLIAWSWVSRVSSWHPSSIPPLLKYSYSYELCFLDGVSIGWNKMAFVHNTVAQACLALRAHKKAKGVNLSPLPIIKIHSYTQTTSHILASVAPKTNNRGFGFYFSIFSNCVILKIWLVLYFLLPYWGER